MSKQLFKQVNIIEVNDWDALVEGTYGKPYAFQQQDGCKEKGSYRISVPIKDPYDFENDTVPESTNHADMGVSFKARHG